MCSLLFSKLLETIPQEENINGFFQSSFQLILSNGFFQEQLMKQHDALNAFFFFVSTTNLCTLGQFP